jgi:PST family polysaccharide transporter
MSIIGSSQVFVILAGVIRTKVIAILLGPLGIGIIGIYQSIVDTLRSVSMLGVDTAGVREVAEANGGEDQNRLRKVVSYLHKWFYISALGGFLLCLVFCYPISLWVFGDGTYSVYIALLSIGVFLSILNTGKSVILQGLRKIPEMAKASIWGSVLGLVLTLPIYYFLRLDGIIPALIVNAAILLICTQYYYKKLALKNVNTSAKEALKNTTHTLKLGIYIVIASAISALSVFAIKAYLSRSIGLESAGLFQSSWVIATVYLGLIFKTMGTDYFPRLSAIINDKKDARKLINEQLYIILAVASPLIIIMLLFSNPLLSLLYSSEFVYADGVLQWQLIATFLKVISWPAAFVMLAKNKGRLFLLTEVIFYTVYLLFSYFLFTTFGLDAIGIGYFIAYVVYLPLVFYIAYSITDYGWNKDITVMATINTILVGISFYLAYYVGDSITLPAIAILLLSTGYSCFKLGQVFSLNDIRNRFKKK